MELKVQVVLRVVCVFALLGSTFMFEPTLSASSSIIRVPQDYPTITQAIDASNPGDTIIVSEGTYADNIEVNKPNLTLIADGEAVAKGFVIIADNVTLEGFTIANGGWGIALDHVQECVIAYNTVIDNRGPGILLFASKENTIIGNNVSFTSSNGIELQYSSNNTFINNTSTQNEGDGITLRMAYWNILIGNTVSKNTVGISADEGTTLIGNIAVNNRYGIIVSGGGCILRNNTMNNNTRNFALGYNREDISSLIHDIDSSNLVDGKEILYLLNQKDIIVDPTTFPNTGYVAIINSTGITVRDLEISNNEKGVFLAYVEDSTVTNMTIQMCGRGGIHVYKANNTMVMGNVVTNCWIGISVETSRNVTVNRNIAKYNGYGFLVGTSHHYVTYNVADSNRNGGILIAGNGNVVVGNTCVNTTKDGLLTGGIVIQGGRNCTIMGNIIKWNPTGFTDWFAKDNLIYHNNFIENNLQVLMTPWSDNNYDGGYPTGGNYWSDYNGSDSDGDGIGDTPYIVSGDRVDHYPLMNLANPLPGDVNWDGRVDIYDLIVQASIYGITEEDAGWNVFADLAPRWGVINIFDLVMCAYHYGETYP